jgi:hypothetical protein
MSLYPRGGHLMGRLLVNWEVRALNGNAQLRPFLHFIRMGRQVFCCRPTDAPPPLTASTQQLQAHQVAIPLVQTAGPLVHHPWQPHWVLLLPLLAPLCPC